MLADVLWNSMINWNDNTVLRYLQPMYQICLENNVNIDNAIYRDLIKYIKRP